MPLIPLNIPKGQYRNGTEYQSQGRWRDVNLVRWHEDSLRPIGGWRTRTAIDFEGTPRSIFTWTDNSNDIYITAGTFEKLYVVEAGGTKTDITPAGFTSGRLDASINLGYGGSFYGTGPYGEERPQLVAPLRATTWALDNWGEYLLAMSPDDGKLYEWQLNTATPAAVVANAPTGCTSMMVTEERFVVCFGAAGNPRNVKWSDREDNTSWTPLATNEAGDIDLQTSGEILRGVRTRGLSLILTTEDTHIMTYSGPPYVMGIERVGTSCGLTGAMAVASVDAGVFWMGRRNFFVYSGGAVQALQCEVSDYVFSDMNYNQRSKISCTVNSAWNEIWWFYPSSGSTECDRYVAFDYVENIWTTGEIDRTAGVDRGSFRLPMFVSSAGVLYEHEVGFEYSGASPYAETGPISIGAGDQVMSVRELIPDEKTLGDVSATFKTRFYPTDTERDYGPYSMANPTSIRFTGRQIRMRVTGDASSDWRVGIMRLDAVAGGKR